MLVPFIWYFREKYDTEWSNEDNFKSACQDSGSGTDLLEADGAWHQKIRVLPLVRTC